MRIAITVAYSLIAGSGIAYLEPSVQFAALIPAITLGCLIATWGGRNHG